jgi:hypothetical protein
MCTPTAAGKILVWKRKAEEYLTASGMCCLALYAFLKGSRVMAAGIRHSVYIRITDSAGLNYTIIHPGGLFDEEVRTGCRAVPAHCTFRPATCLSRKHMHPSAPCRTCFTCSCVCRVASVRLCSGSMTSC